MLQELYTKVMGAKKVSSNIMSAPENSLNTKAKPIIAQICTKYNDLATVDKVASLQDKVEMAKSVMEDNISKTLDNSVSAERLCEKSEQALSEAGKFRDKSEGLRRQMACKKLKLDLLQGVLAVLIVVSVLVPVIRWANN